MSFGVRTDGELFDGTTNRVCKYVQSRFGGRGAFSPVHVTPFWKRGGWAFGGRGTLQFDHTSWGGGNACHHNNKKLLQFSPAERLSGTLDPSVCVLYIIT